MKSRCGCPATDPGAQDASAGPPRTPRGVVRLARGGGSIELGRGAEYEPGAVVYRSSDRFFVVRRDDGSMIALSDLDPHKQSGQSGQSSCRVTFRPDLGSGEVGSGEAGAEDAFGRFFDACTGSMYDISGRGLAGDGLDLSRLTLKERDGRLSAKPAD